MLLNGFLYCPQCDNQLVVTGANGISYGCKTCKHVPVDQQFLYSSMPRRLGTDLIINAICDKVFSDEAVMANCVEQFLVEAERMQKPDPRQLAKLKKNRQEVKAQLGMLIRTFKGADEDLVQDQLNEFRCQLATLDSRIVKEQKCVDQAITVGNGSV